VPDQPFYRSRDRAESFGGVAGDYDRHRPGYPAQLMDDLAALAAEVGGASAVVLDIGCGTGKASVQLRARGLDVLGVEIDERMAEVARSHGISVETGSFESWPSAGRHFDLLVCGQAWHWIDASIGLPKAAALLRPAGGLALFWNQNVLDPGVRDVLEVAYRAHAPQLLTSVGSAPSAGSPESDGWRVDELRATGLFERVEARTYQRSAVFSAAEWTDMVNTHSDHLGLPPERRAALTAALLEVIDGLGGSIQTQLDTYLLLARVPVVAG
jgi:SAM-dependent methyltransferase